MVRGSHRSDHRPAAPCRRRTRSSDQLKSDIDVEAVSKTLQIPQVARRDKVATSRRTNNDRSIDDIGGPGHAAGSTGRTGPSLVEILDPTTRQQPRHLSLRPTPPSLTQDSGRNGGHDASFEGTSMHRPHLAVAPLRCDQRPRVIGDTHHRHEATRSVSASSTPSAHANSCAVSSPCSASHARTAAKPSSRTSARSAAALSQADKLTP